MQTALAIPSSATPSPDCRQLAGLLFCPEDGTQLECVASRIECGACGRCFVISADSVIDLRPLCPAGRVVPENTPYWRGYLQEFRRPYTPNRHVNAWGAPEASDTRWLRKRLRQVVAVRPLIADANLSRTQVLCDLSAGAGNYTFSYASLFRAVVHCDLSVDNLSYAAQKANRLGIRNMFFLRIDYFSPPFQSSLDRVICFDTLIRGESHDAALLDCIRRTLKSEGQAVVDFHNWWHNPVRRLGLLPQNFGENRSYRRPSAAHLLRKTGIVDFDFFPFHQEFDHGAKLHNLLAFALPPTRILYRFTGKAAPSNARQGNHNSKLEADSCG